MQAFLCDEQLVLVRLSGVLRLFPDLCLHRGTALSLGAVKNGCLECPYHGWTYDAEGRVVRMPAREELSGKIRAQLVSYPVAEPCGLVFACLTSIIRAIAA
jgi:vanillate O-demethylase monooxygenase subunit